MLCVSVVGLGMSGGMMADPDTPSQQIFGGACWKGGSRSGLGARGQAIEHLIDGILSFLLLLGDHLAHQLNNCGTAGNRGCRKRPFVETTKE